jgi:hypothetical protein
MERRFGASRKDAVASAHAKNRFFGAKNAPQNDKALVEAATATVS